MSHVNLFMSTIKCVGTYEKGGEIINFPVLIILGALTPPTNNGPPKLPPPPFITSLLGLLRLL